MAIFSILTIQNAINENADFLSIQQLTEHVHRLNRENLQSLDTEWEVIVLNAFSKLGKVYHEVALVDGSKPDIHFVSEELEFFGDITSVNDDDNTERQNPLKPFERELLEKIKKYGLSGAGFHIRIDEIPLPSKFAAKLSLPSKSSFNTDIFDADFKAFLEAIKNAPDQKRSFAISTDEVSVKIDYKPENPYFSQSYPNYRAPTEATRNSLYNSLKTKAQGQIRNIPKGKRKGIIVCDADCHLLSNPTKGWGVTSLNKEMVVLEFLRQNQSVDFVILLRSGFSDSSTGIYDRKNRVVLVDIIPNPLLSNEDKLPIITTMQALTKHFPLPSNTAEGARDSIKRKLKVPTTNLSGYFSVKQNSIKIKAADIAKVLTEEVSLSDFFRSISLDPMRISQNNTGEINNFFRQHAGQRLERVTVERNDQSGDEIEFVFSRNDPTKEVYYVPDKSQSDQMERLPS